MNVILFSKSGIQYESEDKGEIVAVYIPTRNEIRQYSDIPNVNKNTVKERYGDVDLNPLYRIQSDIVTVYGTLSRSLAERRNSIEVYLPQDFVPDGCEVFFLVFGNRWVAHGIKEFKDDGQIVWNTSLLDGEEHGVEKLLTHAISNRLFEGDDERMCVAAHTDKKMFQELQTALEPLGQNLVRFDSLTRKKDLHALYSHRDYGLSMLMTGMMAFMILAASLVYMGLKYVRLDGAREEVSSLEQQIREQQQNRVLGGISDPATILAQMQKPLPQQPSALVHSSADVAAVFGELQSVRLDSNQRSDGYDIGSDELWLLAEVKTGANELLIDQEQIAKSALETRPWVRRLDREPGGSDDTLRLRITLQVK